jgi:hypothetical protein
LPRARLGIDAGGQNQRKAAIDQDDTPRELWTPSRGDRDDEGAHRLADQG